MALPKKERFEDHLAAVEKAVADLEGGKLTLEESLQTYETGIQALQKCYDILKDAEKKIEILMKGQGGEVTVQPFDVKKSDEAGKEARAARKTNPGGAGT
ncbi:MAG: exodeoxyribonuclease VII small subunit [Planctomycetes bacterium]|nr:exodeoxyribonuclease VII small subunit [Planctomycetota bacterium]